MTVDSVMFMSWRTPGSRKEEIHRAGQEQTIHVSFDASWSQQKPFWGEPLERYDASRRDGPSGVDFISQAQSAELSSEITLDQDVPGCHIPMEQMLILEKFLST